MIPKLIDWAKTYLGGNCTDATKNEYVNLVFDEAYIWLNKNGEINGPLDYIHTPSNTGIQLKTIADANNWSNFKTKIKKGLDQLLQAIENGDVTSGRLDVMMPEELSGEFNQIYNKRITEIIDNPSFPQYKDLGLELGAFLG